MENFTDLVFEVVENSALYAMVFALTALAKKTMSEQTRDWLAPIIAVVVGTVGAVCVYGLTVPAVFGGALVGALVAGVVSDVKELLSKK